MIGSNKRESRNKLMKYKKSKKSMKEFKSQKTKILNQRQLSKFKNP